MHSGIPEPAARGPSVTVMMLARVASMTFAVNPIPAIIMWSDLISMKVQRNLASTVKVVRTFMPKTKVAAKHPTKKVQHHLVAVFHL